MDIEVTLPGKLVTVARYGDVTIKTGQPVSSGGDGTRPSPFDLFLVSLASCAGVYAAFFCEKRGIATDGIKVIQKMERDPETHMIVKMRIEVSVPGDFPEKYIKPLLRSVDQCTVKRHMIDAPEFEVTATRM